MTGISTAAGGLRQSERLLPVLFYAAFLLFHVYTQWGRALDVPIPNQYDELQHVSYAVQMRADPALFPNYAELRLIDLDAPTRLTEAPSYLNHPSAYYLLLAPFAGGGDATALFRRLRLVNLALSTAALGILFAAGLAVLREPRTHLVFGLVGALSPIVAELGGQVNNDNAAFLGAALALFGLLRLAGGRCDRRVAATIAAGFAIAALAKLTAGILVGVCVLALHWHRRESLGPAAAHRSAYAAILVGGLLAGMLPYLHNLAVYHAPIYVDRSLLPSAELRLGLVDFLRWFVYALAATWSIYPPADALQIATLAGLLALSLRGIVRAAPGDGAVRATVAACGIAVLAVLPIHFAFSYSLHLTTGHHGGVHIRYYLPMWGGVMFGAALGASCLGGDRRKAAATVALALLLAYSNLVSAGPDGSIGAALARLCPAALDCGGG